MNIWLIGAGTMAAQHAEVLRDIGQDVTIVATSPDRAVPLADVHGMASFTHGLDRALAELPQPDAAIVVLPVNLLAAAALSLVTSGVPRVLIEKPACLSANELEPVVEVIQRTGTFAAVAYNRRFLSSVAEARRRIEAAPEILSVLFEFTEAALRIATLATPNDIKRRWVLANSTHVIDLAFHLCGWPDTLESQIRGRFDWHPSGADFRGFGTTTRGASFSYLADWRGPGRWGLEIVLPEERLILRPMEQLQVIPLGRFASQAVTGIDDRLDCDYKPGLYLQMQAFLATTPDPRLVTVKQQLHAIRSVYNPIAGYDQEKAN